MSKKNYISIDTEKIESLASGLGRLAIKVVNNCDNSKKDFSNIKDAGLMTNSTNKVFSQMQTMSSVFEKGKSMLLTSVERMIETELFISSNAENIKVPKLSTVNSSSFNEEVNSVFLAKNDGVSVNNGGNTNSKNIDFKNVIQYNQKLKNIVNNYETVNGVLEFNYCKKDNLININNEKGNPLDVTQINSNTVIKNVNLSNVKNNVNFYDSEVSINELEV